MQLNPVRWDRNGLVCRTAAVFTLAAMVSWPGWAQQREQQSQEQQGQAQSQEQGQQAQGQRQEQQGQGQQGQGQPGQQADQPPQTAQPQPPAQQAPPPAPTQTNPNRPPVTSRDTIPNSPSNAPYGEPPYGGQYGQPYGDQNDPNGQPPYGAQPNDQYGWPPYNRQYGYGRPDQYGAQNGQEPQHFAPAPSLLTIPAGTVVVIRTNDPLSSDKNQIGDRFTATLQQPIVVDGYVVARRGQTIVGQVKSAKKAGRVTGTSELGLELTDVTLVDGTQAPVLTELWKASGGTSHGQDAATIVGGTGLGAAIGAAADWGRGAAIGAGAGAVAGIGAVLLTRGRPTILLPESELSFKLVDPVKVDTTHSSSAFVPPTQQDFGNGRPTLNGPGGYGYGPGYGPYAGGPYAYPSPYAAAPCGYYYPCYGYYGPYVGVYPGFGWGWGVYGRGYYGRWGWGYRRY
jgi:hypothetical protein